MAVTFQILFILFYITCIIICLFSGHPRIAIVVTDGQSNNPPKTLVSAMNAHAADITVFAVGVGAGINLKELDGIASDPICLHKIILAQFTEFDSLKDTIQQRACEGAYIEQ